MLRQVRQLPYSERVGLDHEYIYTGKLYAPQESSPAKMIVRFPLSEYKIGLAAKMAVDITHPL